MKQFALHACLITTIAVAVFFSNLGKARLWDRDEPRNAGCAAEMMERGDYVVPMFNDELRHQKPVLLYWLMMSAYAVFGVNEFSARFWSALLALGTVWMTYAIARRLFRPAIGMMSAIVLSTTLMFGVAGRAATPDSVLIFCSTLALLIYVFGTFARKESLDDAPKLRVENQWFPSSWVLVALMYAVMGLGVLAKGLAGAVLPTAIIGMFLLIQRLPALNESLRDSHSRFGLMLIAIARTFNPLHFLKTCWAMRPLTAIAMILLVAAPWYIAVGIQTEGDFLKEFLIGEHFGRATTAMENHRGNLLYYPTTILLGFFPWSIFAIPVMICLDRCFVRKDSSASGLAFLACWALVQVGIFSVAKTKLPSYITPCYPALAMLTAFFMWRVWERSTTVNAWWMRGSFAALALAGLGIGIGMIFVGKEYLAGEIRLAFFGIVPLVGGVVALIGFWKDRPKVAIGSMFVTAVLFVGCFFGIGTVIVDSHQQSYQVTARANELAPEAPLATYRCLESSWVVYADRPIIELFPVVDESESVDSERARFWHDQPDMPVMQYLDENPGGLIITRTDTLDELKPFLPDGYEVLGRAPFFLQKDELVLIGPSESKSNPMARQASASRFSFVR